MSRKYFGTDGVRGPYGGPVINEAFAERLGYAAAVWLKKKGRVVIGRDTRASGECLVAAVARGLRAGGCEAISLGVLPTPAVARAVRLGGAPLGVVITASHNPAADNGIKFFGPGGVKLTDADELAIERLLPETLISPNLASPHEEAASAYRDGAAQLLPARALAGWRVVLDTANGATCATSPAVLRTLGAEVIGIGDAPNGTNINEGVGSEHPEALAARVLKEGARLGIAHDGDGDRCVLCDELGGVLDGDEILTILATHALTNRTLSNKTLVITVQSNLGVDAAIAAAGGRVARTSVGDRYVIERMLADGATLGGESSGHIICSDISPTGDGLVAALKVIEVMLATGKPLSELRRRLKKFPQLTAALRVKEKRPLAELPQLTATIKAVEGELGAQGRVLVRYSGTEAKLRLLVEGPTDAIVRGALDRLEAAVRAELEVLG
ncbi:MAG: phosphoglucosamine mutase [Verrucomicrobia bacterium]|nr:phosphoglucosamine mutase [Verrucomicrobiota bacterium]